MNCRKGYIFFDSQKLLEKAKDIHAQFLGKRYDAEAFKVSAKSLEKFVSKLGSKLIRKSI